MLVKLSNFAVKPLRKIIPSFKKIDLSTGLLAYFCQLLLGLLMLFFGQYRPFIFDYLFFLNLFAIAALGVTIISVTIFLYAVLIQAILSWINPYTPISAILDALSQPVLSVTRRLVPAVGGVDLTALVFLMMAQVLLLTILNPLQSALLTS